MSYTTELLDLAKVNQDITSDYRLAQLLGTSPANVSNYRRGVTRPVNEVAWRLGELCGIDPAQALIGINLERISANPRELAVWRALGERLVSAGMAHDKLSTATNA